MKKDKETLILDVIIGTVILILVGIITVMSIFLL